MTTRNPTVPIATNRRPGDAERCEAVVDGLRLPCGALVAQYGTVALLDGMLSLYAGLAIRAFGVAQTQAALKAAADNLPRLAAAIGAAERQSPEGSA